MDVKTFTQELLDSLSDTGLFTRVTLQVETPVSSGYAYTGNEELFLRFYFNEMTGTVAFALIEAQQRIWGIDYDNRRGWHLHPETDSVGHIKIEPLSVSEIVAQLQNVLFMRTG
ncbi:MAG: hypothetical protein GY797_16485 [Deltaproteobacteria bacterium]|nr:hypothetical protein [Deltaproteobacteria bacterium]